jgi:hypothetical protein
MDRFNKVTLQALRPEVQAALDAIAAKHGIKLQLGNISFTPDGSSFTSKIEGKVEALADEAARKVFLQYAEMYGLDPEKVGQTPQGEVRLVGFLPKKRTKPWQVTINGKAGYIVDDRYAQHYFKSDKPRPELVETAPPARTGA